MGLFDLFRKRRQPSYATAMGGRYAGRPLLILLENYILGSIGCLPPDKEEVTASITRRIFGEGPDWRATLRTSLHLEAAMDESLREMWDDNQARAQEAGVTLSPEDFARMVADKNFAHLIEPIT